MRFCLRKVSNKCTTIGAKCRYFSCLYPIIEILQQGCIIRIHDTPHCVCWGIWMVRIIIHIIKTKCMRRFLRRHGHPKPKAQNQRKKQTDDFSTVFVHLFFQSCIVSIRTAKKCPSLIYYRKQRVCVAPNPEKSKKFTKTNKKTAQSPFALCACFFSVRFLRLRGTDSFAHVRDGNFFFSFLV